MTLKTSHLHLRRRGRSGHDAEHLGRRLGCLRRSRSTHTSGTRREISLVDIIRGFILPSMVQNRLSFQREKLA